MTIQVKFFASLADELGRSEAQCEAAGVQTAAEVWKKLLGDRAGARIKVAINQQYADWHSAVADGDEVAFFPPVTGG